MYRIYYIFRVKRANSVRFMDITRAAADIYRLHGAIDSTIARVTNSSSQYGCRGLGDAVRAEADEDLFLGCDSFADADEFTRVSAILDSDPELARLFGEIQTVVDLASVVRWEANEI